MVEMGVQESCGESVIGLLEARGVEVVFGIPGVHTLELYRGLAASSIRHVTPRHEQGAAFMADGYARVSRRPGVCLLITGAGVTNAATAVASAHHDSQPVLIISSATDSRHAGRGRGRLHDLPDQQRLMASIAGSSETVGSPEQLAGAVERAFAVLEGPRPRPAHIGIPIDVLALPAVTEMDDNRSSEGRPAGPSAPAEGDPHALDLAAEVLAGARAPMILLGGGAIDAGAAALAVAEAIGAPVATTVNGKGAVPETHPASLGATLTLEPVYGALQSADVVLAVGTELSEVDYYYQADIPQFAGTLIRVDTDPGQLTNGREPALAIVGDAGRVLEGLAGRLRGSTADRSQASAARAQQLRSALEWWPGAESFFSVLDTISAALPPEAIVCADSTQLAYVANSYMPVARPRSYLAPVGYGTLGPALPMAIGAKLAAPQRPVVCLIGDGGLLFTVAELATAAAEQIPVIVLVWHNDGYGEIRDSMDRAAVPHIGTDASAQDFVTIARGFGCHADRIDSTAQLSQAIAQALVRNRPTVLELPAQLAR